jgi:hypothetical protein
MLRAAVVVLAFLLAPAHQAQAPISLELRVFNGAEEVTAETRVTVYRGGERTEPVAQLPGAARLETQVPPGIYDVQAIREVDGNVVSIRWAERLVVMPYPDEGGRHLQVVNFKNGYGALQVRAKGSPAAPEVAIFGSGARDKEAGARLPGTGYALFVVPAGKYDLRTGAGDRVAWHHDIEVPLERTRLWIVP